MKKLLTMGLLLSFFLSIPAFSQVLLEEEFDQPAGTALSTFGWTAHSGGTTNAISVVEPGLTYAGYDLNGGNAAALTTSGQDVNHAFSDTTIASGSIYTSFLVNVTSAQAAGDYFFHYSFAPYNTSIFMGRVFVKLTANGNLAFGLSKSSVSASIPAVYTDSVYTTGITYLFVVKYTFGADATDDEVSLFINPDLSAAEPAAALVHDTASANDPDKISAIALRQGSGSNAANVIIDGIRVAQSWSDLYNDLITIAEAREDLNADYIPDRLNNTVHVRGVVISPNYQTVNRSYYIWDGTAGVDIFCYGLTIPELSVGDEVDVVGKVYQYNGLTEILVESDSGWFVLSSGNPIPDPQVITIAEFKANFEDYEGELVAFTNLTKASGTWPTSGNATIKLTDGIDTLDVYLDSDTDNKNNPEPAYPTDVIGIASQFSSSSLTAGYQLLPRTYATDLLPGGTLPVELLSFSAKANGSSVKLSWSTASEKNNRGFEIERKSVDGSFRSVGFVSGNGTTSQQQLYSFVDACLQNGTYSYRLKQVDFDGTYEYSAATEVTVNVPHRFSLDQNFPNPFNPSTTIKFTLAVDSKVDMKIFNILGQEVSTLVNSNYVAGPHEIKFNASNLNSGVYFYKLIVSGIDGSSFSSVKKMILAK
jgi:hypothetical protein